MTETKSDRIVKRGRIFPEIQWSEEQKAEWKARLAGIRERCQLVFQQIQPELMKSHYNWFIAIDPESEDYFIAENEDLATEMAQQKYPNAIPYIFVINETGVSGRI
jgi:hypothetical protein